MSAELAAPFRSVIYRAGDWLSDGAIMAHERHPLYRQLFDIVPSDGVWRLTGKGPQRVRDCSSDDLGVFSEVMAGDWSLVGMIDKQAPSDLEMAIAELRRSDVGCVWEMSPSGDDSRFVLVDGDRAISVDRFLPVSWFIRWDGKMVRADDNEGPVCYLQTCSVYKPRRVAS